MRRENTQKLFRIRRAYVLDIRPVDEEVGGDWQTKNLEQLGWFIRQHLHTECVPLVACVCMHSVCVYDVNAERVLSPLGERMHASPQTHIQPVC